MEQSRMARVWLLNESKQAWVGMPPSRFCFRAGYNLNPAQRQGNPQQPFGGQDPGAQQSNPYGRPQPVAQQPQPQGQPSVGPHNAQYNAANGPGYLHGPGAPGFADPQAAAQVYDPSDPQLGGESLAKQLARMQRRRILKSAIKSEVVFSQANAKVLAKFTACFPAFDKHWTGRYSNSDIVMSLKVDTSRCPSSISKPSLCPSKWHLWQMYWALCCSNLACRA